MTPIRFSHVLLSFAVSALAYGGSPPRDRYLLLDDRIVQSVVNAKLTVGKVSKSARNPLFVEDRPWEARFDNLYANVLYDDDERIYKCWYSPFIVDRSAAGMTLEQRLTRRYRPPHDREMGVCYATSQDGLEWHKPMLGIVDFGGNTENNLVYRRSSATEHEPHGVGVFKDVDDLDERRRYKMFFKGQIISVAFSPDGRNWGPGIACPEANVRGDTHNNAFWAPTAEKYVGITRRFSKQRGRQVARTSSTDFVHWSSAEVVLEGLEDHLQTYSMPVFFHGGVYLGLVAIFNTKTDRVHTELAWSPDSSHWNRIDPGSPLIPNGQREGAYDWGCVYAGAGPVFEKDHIRLYYGGSDGLHTGYRNGSFCVATLRPDGFAGYKPRVQSERSSVTTTPVRSGETIRLNADVGEGGFVDIRVLSLSGDELARTERIVVRAIDAETSWETGLRKDAFDVSTLPETVRLEFTFRNATIYSFAWR